MDILLRILPVILIFNYISLDAMRGELTESVSSENWNLFEDDAYRLNVSIENFTESAEEFSVAKETIKTASAIADTSLVSEKNQYANTLTPESIEQSENEALYNFVDCPVPNCHRKGENALKATVIYYLRDSLKKHLFHVHSNLRNTLREHEKECEQNGKWTCLINGCKKKFAAKNFFTRLKVHYIVHHMNYEEYIGNQTIAEYVDCALRKSKKIKIYRLFCSQCASSFYECDEKSVLINNFIKHMLREHDKVITRKTAHKRVQEEIAVRKEETVNKIYRAWKRRKKS